MFRKYEKTYRILVPQVNVHGKYFLSSKETKLLLGGTVTILEKLDGANVGVIRTKDGFRLQKRGSLVGESEHEQYNFFRDWTYRNYEKLMQIPKRYIVYGELLRCVHNIYYDKLPDWFCVFSIWDGDEYLKWDDVKEFCSKVGLATVPELSKGHFFKDQLFDFIPDVSKYGSEKAEGIVVWNYRQQLRGKVVREEFVKELEESDHWIHKELKFNTLVA